jgi:hypothetical protein
VKELNNINSLFLYVLISVIVVFGLEMAIDDDDLLLLLIGCIVGILLYIATTMNQSK